MGLERQKRLVATLDCGISGPGKHLQAIHVRVDRSGPDLFVAAAYELMQWRGAGYAKAAD